MGGGVSACVFRVLTGGALDLGGLWADQVLEVLGVYPFFWVLRLAVSPLRRVTFSKRRKGNRKGLLLRAARSLGLGVPSLRDRSGRSASGLLRCTSSRCVWLRQTVAALPRPEQSLRSAFRRRPWIKIKSGSRACAHPGVGRHAPRAGCTYLPCRSCRRLRSSDLISAFALLWEQACQRWRPASRQSPTECTQSHCRSCRRLRSFDLQNQKIAAFGSSYTVTSCDGLASRVNLLQQGAVVCCRLADFYIIQHSVHRQFGEHDDLLNGQNRPALRGVDVRGDVAGHDARRGQWFAGVNQQAFVVHIRGDLEHAAGFVESHCGGRGFQVVIQRTLGGVVELSGIEGFQQHLSASVWAGDYASNRMDYGPRRPVAECAATTRACPPDFRSTTGATCGNSPAKR